MPSPIAPLAEVVRAADGLADVAWDDLAPADLLAAAAALGRSRNQVEAALVAVAGRVAEPASADALGAAGWASAKDFLTHVTGGRKGAGGGLVRAAEQTAEQPAVRAAMAAGRVSPAQARVIGAGVARLPHLPELRDHVAARMLDLAVAGGRDATDLDRALAAVVREVDPDGRLVATDLDLPLLERAAHRARYLSLVDDAFGGVRITGYTSREDAETVKATLVPSAAPVATEPGACGGDPARRGPFRDEHGRRVRPGCPDPTCAHDGSDPREHGARMHDALLDACRRLQATDALPTSHATTARLTVTVGLDDLRSGLGEAAVPGAATLSASTARRLACDAEVVPAVLGADSSVLDVGRSQRLVTAAIWLALVLRDQHCAFPGCARLPAACDAHHVTHWADGGVTSLDNLVLLCRRHHTLAHHAPWTVHLDPATRRPVWTPPSPVDDSDRLTVVPAVRPPPTPHRAA